MQRQEMYLQTCAPKDDLNQTAYPRCLIKVFVVRMTKLRILTIQHAPSEDPNQTALILMFAETTCPNVRCLTLQLK